MRRRPPLGDPGRARARPLGNHASVGRTPLVAPGRTACGGQGFPVTLRETDVPTLVVRLSRNPPPRWNGTHHRGGGRTDGSVPAAAGCGSSAARRALEPFAPCRWYTGVYRAVYNRHP